MTATTAKPDDIVGHKTLSDGKGGHSHEPLTRDEADSILRACEEARDARVAAMPDEAAALRQMHQAYIRLQELGWSEAIYCPKDGSMFNVIEAGSTGVHRCNYQGKWPDGKWWVYAEGDVWPSRPILYKLDREGEALRQQRMQAAAAQYRAEQEAKKQ